MTELRLPPAAVAGAAPSQLRRLASDSGWSLAVYGVTAMTGFGFWTLAARLLPPSELGLDTAIISAVTAAAAVAAGLLNNAFLVLLPLAGNAAGRLLRSGMTVVVAASLVTGTTAGVLLSALVVREDPVAVVLGAVLLTVLMTVFAVKDPVFLATGRVRLSAAINVPANLLKLLLLPLLVLIGAGAAHPVVLATAGAAGAAVVAAVIVLLRPTTTSAIAATTAPTASLLRFVVLDGTAVGLTFGVTTAIPFLVTVAAGSKEGAVFALCAQLGMILDLVVTAITGAFATNFARLSHSDSVLAVAVWRRLVALVALGAVGLVVVGPLLLTAFGPYYVRHGGWALICVLALGSLLRSNYELWAATRRARRSPAPVLVCAIAFAGIAVPAALVLATRSGALGAGLALLCTFAALGVVGVLGLRHELFRRTA